MANYIRGGKNIMVMCETYKYNKEPTETNHRKVGNNKDIQQDYRYELMIL